MFLRQCYFLFVGFQNNLEAKCNLTQGSGNVSNSGRIRVAYPCRPALSPRGQLIATFDILLARELHLICFPLSHMDESVRTNLVSC
jgi:hypothetical protein